MNNKILLDEIEYWKEIFSKNENPELLELAFFKIFIKFEKFISDIFIEYCIGNQSSEAFCPIRKLSFLDENQLNAIIKKENSLFVNHYDAVFRLSEHIFENNPFEIISKDAIFTVEILNMKTIRDYIAHESSHSKKLYQNRLLNGKFLKPYEFLNKTKKANSISYYSYYIDIMKKTSEYIIKGPA